MQSDYTSGTWPTVAETLASVTSTLISNTTTSEYGRSASDKSFSQYSGNEVHGEHGKLDSKLPFHKNWCFQIPSVVFSCRRKPQDYINMHQYLRVKVKLSNALCTSSELMNKRKLCEGKDHRDTHTDMKRMISNAT